MAKTDGPTPNGADVSTGPQHDTLGRRSLFGAVSLAATALVSRAEARTIKGGMPWQPSQADQPHPLQADHRLFLSADEARFLDAACERIFPTDSRGPGAKDLGVTRFLDGQLAGPFGSAQTWYMQGPWERGTASQGFQARQPPAQLYRAAIAAIDKAVAAAHGGKAFAALAPADQDSVLADLESGKLELAGVDGKTFFKMLLQNTKEGVFSDPIYGGNKDMGGWKMIGFPGARYNYLPYVKRFNEDLALSPVGIAAGPGWVGPARNGGG
jgi:gluconate 2-dehydrogenase gamma chain